jgi:predicted PurR-regulated permease PerM
MQVPPPPPSSIPTARAPRREPFDPAPRILLLLVLGLLVVALAYLLRAVLVPLFFAFLVAYALDPAVDRLERAHVPRPLGAALILLAITSGLAVVLIYAVPVFTNQVRTMASELPAKLSGLEARLDPWVFQVAGVHVPHTMSEVVASFGSEIRDALPTTLNTVALALFGTLSYVAVALSTLIVPVFALFLLIDFNRIVAHVARMIPKRWQATARSLAGEIHHTLGSYLRGQLVANVVLGTLYAVGLKLVGIQFAIPIGLLTGMLAFVPYVGFSSGLALALTMTVLDWQGIGTLAGVLVVMGVVQLLDGLVITPRIVGRSVGLAPLEVIVTMMATASLFGFFGVLLAVPLGAVVKILWRRIARSYLRSTFHAAHG